MNLKSFSLALLLLSAQNVVASPSEAVAPFLSMEGMGRTVKGEQKPLEAPCKVYSEENVIGISPTSDADVLFFNGASQFPTENFKEETFTAGKAYLVPEPETEFSNLCDQGVKPTEVYLRLKVAGKLVTIRESWLCDGVQKISQTSCKF